MHLASFAKNAYLEFVITKEYKNDKAYGTSL